MRHFDKVDFTGEISTCDRVDGICDALSRPLIANAELSEPLPSRTRYGPFLVWDICNESMVEAFCQALAHVR